MNPSLFQEIILGIRTILRSKSREEVKYIRKLVDFIAFLSDEQYTLLIQELAHIEDLKKPSCKAEFDKIMKAGGF